MQDLPLRGTVHWSMCFPERTVERIPVTFLFERSSLSVWFYLISFLSLSAHVWIWYPLTSIKTLLCSGRGTRCAPDAEIAMQCSFKPNKRWNQKRCILYLCANVATSGWVSGSSAYCLCIVRMSINFVLFFLKTTGAADVYRHDLCTAQRKPFRDRDYYCMLMRSNAIDRRFSNMICFEQWPFHSVFIISSVIVLGRSDE